jgi:hypothetical protein
MTKTEEQTERAFLAVLDPANGSKTRTDQFANVMPTEA